MTGAAVIYCRVSTKEQTQNLSLSTQLKACIDFCVRHSLDVLQNFTEEGESAKTADRPELKRLLEYCREHKGRVQSLVVYNVSRLARDKHDHFAIITTGHISGPPHETRSRVITTDVLGGAEEPGLLGSHRAPKMEYFKA